MRQSGAPSGRTFRLPTNNRAVSWMGRWVADRPMRVTGPEARAQRRSHRQGKVCAPLVSSNGVDFVQDQGLDAA